MAESRSAYIVIIGVTLLGVMAASIGISELMSTIILPIALVVIPIWLLVRWVKHGRTIVECRGCGVKSTWKNFRKAGRCMACGSDLRPVSTGERES